MRDIASTIGIDGQAIRDLRIGRRTAAYPIQWLTDNGSCYAAKERESDVEEEQQYRLIVLRAARDSRGFC